MLPHDVFILAMLSFIVIIVIGAPANFDLEDYQKMLDEEQSIDKGNVSAKNKRCTNIVPQVCKQCRIYV